MRTSTNLGLKLIDGTDVVNIDDITTNFENLDSNVVKKEPGKGLSTNDYTTAEKNKLGGIATGANNYVHPTTHPPSIIAQDANNRFMTDAERNKLSGITVGANNYVHPSTHPASMIAEETNKRFMTDAERSKLSGIAGGANNYVHPSTHPASMIEQDSARRMVSDAQIVNWDNLKPSLPMLTLPSETYPCVMPGWYVQSSIGLPFDDGVIYYVPIFVDRLTNFKGIAVYANSGVANTSVALRVYKMDTVTTLPTVEVIGVGSVSMETSGLKEIVATFKLESGFYFVGIRCTGNPILTCIDNERGFTAPVTSRMTSGVYPNGRVVYSTTGVMTNPANPPTDFANKFIPIVRFRL